MNVCGGAMPLLMATKNKMIKNTKTEIPLIGPVSGTKDLNGRLLGPI